VTAGVIAIEIRQIGFEPGTFDIRIRPPASCRASSRSISTASSCRGRCGGTRSGAGAALHRFRAPAQSPSGCVPPLGRAEEGGYSSIGDALRTVRAWHPVRPGAIRVLFRHGPHTNCQPTWWVDGIEVHSFHENTAIRDVYGIEVIPRCWRDPAGVRRLRCGVRPLSWSGRSRSRIADDHSFEGHRSRLASPAVSTVTRRSLHAPAYL